MPHIISAVNAFESRIFTFYREYHVTNALNAAYLTLHMRHSFIYAFWLNPLSCASVETTHEAGQFHEVRDTQEPAPFTHDDLRIRGNQICPLRSHRANGRIVDLQQQSLAVAVVALAHAGELLSAERVERMRYAYKARRSGGNVCIPD